MAYGAPEGTQYEGLMLYLKAKLEYEQGHYDAAIFYDMKALTIFEGLESGMECGSAYHLLGQCYSKNSKTFDLGIKQLQKCMTIWKKYRAQFSGSMVKIHQMIADVYYDNKQYSQALMWYQKCMSLLNNQTTMMCTSVIRDRILKRMEECGMQELPSRYSQGELI